MSRDAYDFKADEGKFCVKCRHVEPAGPRPECGNEACLGPVDPVTGNQERRSCSWARSLGAPCGPFGLLFQARIDR